MTKCSECSNNEKFGGNCFGGILWDTLKTECESFSQKKEDKTYMFDVVKIPGMANVIINPRKEVSPKQQAPKHDTDPYEKPDLSLVPLDILEQEWTRTASNGKLELFKKVYEGTATVADCLNVIPCHDLAISLGYGVAKYNDRDGWKTKGFGGNPQRFKRPALSHFQEYMKGNDYDGEAIDGYPKGNKHIGAVFFSVMVSESEKELMENK